MFKRRMNRFLKTNWRTDAFESRKCAFLEEKRRVGVKASSLRLWKIEAVSGWHRCQGWMSVYLLLYVAVHVLFVPTDKMFIVCNFHWKILKNLLMDNLCSATGIWTSGYEHANTDLENEVVHWRLAQTHLSWLLIGWSLYCHFWRKFRNWKLLLWFETKAL